MANKNGRNITLGAADFSRLGAVGQPLPQVNHDGGEAGRAASAVGGTLANQFFEYADKLAAEEGARAGRQAGLDPNYRPEGAWTIKGRAHEKAATDSYLSNLQVSFKGDALDLWDKHKDDPEGFKNAFAGLTQRYEKTHVFDEIKSDFRVQAGNFYNGLKLKALDNFEEKQRDARRAQLITDTAAADGQRQKLLAADPNAESTATQVRLIGAENKLRLDVQVQNGTIDAKLAAKQKIAIDNETESALALARAKAAPNAKAVEEVRAATKKQFVDGKLPPTFDHETLDAQLEKEQRRKEVLQGHDARILKQGVDALLERAGDGFTPTAADWALINQQAAKIGDAGAALVDEARQKLQVRQKINALPEAQAEASVAAIEAEARKRDNPVWREVAADARAHLETRRKQLRADPVTFAEKDMGLPVTAVDFSAPPEKLAEQLRARLAVADAANSKTGRKWAGLKPEEKEAAQAVLAKGGEPANALIKGVVAADPRRAVGVLAEIGEGAPALAHAGLVSVKTGDDGFMRQVAKAQAARAAPGAKVPTPKADDIEREMREQFGNAIAGLSAEERATTRAAATHWIEEQARLRNIDPTDATAAKDIIREGLQRARGMNGQGAAARGGVIKHEAEGNWFTRKVTPVEIPPTVRRDGFGKALGAITDEDLKALPDPPVRKDGGIVSAAELRRAHPRLVDGGYRFTVTPDSDGKPFEPIQSKSGGAFTLPWKQLEPELRKRAPGAFE